MIGETIITEWQKLSAGGPESLSVRIAPYAGDVVRRLLSSARSGICAFCLFTLWAL
jgi:hypothetical protein